MPPTTPAPPPAEWPRLKPRLERLSTLLDSAVTVPGTRITLGLDAAIGLVPVAGDLAGLALGLWLLWQARQLRAPARLQLRMIGNLALEAVLGSVPLLGDLLDVAWRANRRNVTLLRQWAEPPAAPEPSRPGRHWLLAVLLGLVLLASWQLAT